MNLSSAVEHLSLHYQVENLKLPGRQSLNKLLALKKDCLLYTSPSPRD